MKIYFANTKKAENIEQLLQNGFINNFFEETYKDIKLKKLQCCCAYRSFLDLYWICKTYFPKTTKKELAKTLFKLHKKIGLAAHFCDDIRKVVFYKNGFTYIQLGDYIDKDKKGVGRYSFRDIEKLAQIKIKKNVKN